MDANSVGARLVCRRARAIRQAPVHRCRPRASAATTASGRVSRTSAVAARSHPPHQPGSRHRHRGHPHGNDGCVDAAGRRWDRLGRRPGGGIGVRVADCAPILLADTSRPAVAAVHAGWRGTMQGIAGVAVAALAREFGCRAEDLIAGDRAVPGPLLWRDGTRGRGHVPGGRTR